MNHSIIFDTNCFFDNYRLQSPVFTATLKVCRNTDDIQFALPMIVKDEVIQNFSESITSLHSKIHSHIDSYNDLTDGSETFRSKEELTAEIDAYKVTLDRIIEDYQIKVLDYPTIPHPEMVSRYNNSMKPFSSNDAGYKDTLIWLTILNLLQSTDDHVIFITKDGDFGNDNSLFKGLKVELDNLSIPLDRIHYYSSISNFFESEIKPRTLVIDTIEQIRANDYEAFSFENYIDENLHDILSEKQSSIDLSYISAHLHRPVVDHVDDINFLELIDARRIDDNQIILEYDIGANVNCDVLVDRYGVLDNLLSEAIYINNHSFNASYMEGDLFLQLQISLILIFDTEENAIVSEEVDEIIGQDYS